MFFAIGLVETQGLYGMFVLKDSDDLFQFQIEVDQIFALNPSLVVQPKAKNTVSNKRISTPSSKVTQA